MSRVKLRSPRDPQFWLPLGLSLIVVVALGLYGHARVSDWVEHLEMIAAGDPRAALDEAIYWLRRAALFLCALLALICAFLFRSCQLARREGRLPPSGWWSYGALWATTGDRARRQARIGQWLAGVLLAAAVCLGLAVEYTARLLLAGEF